MWSKPAAADNDQQNSQMTPQQGFVIIGAILAILGYQKLGNLEPLYAKYFETIWLSAFGLAVCLASLFIWFIKKKTRKFSDRYQLLAPYLHGQHGIYIGNTHDNVSLYVPDEVRTGHVQVLGGTGRGKTESVVFPWMCRDILQGKSAILIDGKGLAGWFSKIETLAKYLPTPPEVFLFDVGSEESCTTNPLQFGTPQQIADRIFCAFQFEDPYYKAVQYDICSHIVWLVKQELKEDVTFKRLHELLSEDNALAEAISKCGNKRIQTELLRFLKEPRHKRDKSLSGLLSQLGPFALGELAPYLNGPVPGKPYITLSDILLGDLKGHQRIFIGLIPNLKYQTSGNQIGRLLLQEMGAALAERGRLAEEGPSRFLPIFVDEFAEFVYPGFTNVLNKARSSNVGLHLSHQSVGDLGAVSESFATTVNTNTNVKCLLGINDPETADFFAKHLGTHTKEKITEQARNHLFDMQEKTGALSIREVEAYNIHPNQLKNYFHGHGAIHFPGKTGNVTEEIHFARFSPDEIEGPGSDL